MERKQTSARLRDKIERYERLRRGTSDERLRPAKCVSIWQSWKHGASSWCNRTIPRATLGAA
jgi:hypothetical protein